MLFRSSERKLKNDKENKERAKRLVAPADRVLLTLRWADRLTDAEIAAATGMTVATVAERLAVVERTLRERLKGDFANA